MNPLRARNPQHSDYVLPKETVQKLERLRTDYDAAVELFEKQHGRALRDAIQELEQSAATDLEKQEKIITRMLASNCMIFSFTLSQAVTKPDAAPVRTAVLPLKSEIMRLPFS